MPDLGAYAFEVTLAYAGALAMIAVLVGVSLAQARKAKQRLAQTEHRTDDA